MSDIKLIIDGKEYICRPVEEAYMPEIGRPRTGYERVEIDSDYYATSATAAIAITDAYSEDDDKCYERGNYYNNPELAAGIARADTLMRRMRQWQALNDDAVDWNDLEYKHFIYFNYGKAEPDVDFHDAYRDFGQIYFSSEEKAVEAIEVFYDELMWYFTEYRQRLDEPKGDK